MKLFYWKFARNFLSPPIRTVASLGREEYFINKYQEKLDTPLKNHTKKAYLYGFLYGMANSTEFFMYAAIFRFAAWLIEDNYMQSSDFDNIFKVLFSLVFGAMTAGEASAMMPDQAQANQARVSESPASIVLCSVRLTP